jgi:hypothetical protein
METDLGEQIVRWTARLAVAAYLCRLTADLWSGRLFWPASTAGIQSVAPMANRAQHFCGGSDGVVRWIWTAGSLVYLLHVAAAFHFVHDWSHAAAWAQTAQQTAAVTGWYWGGGLWINYAFTLWWPLDVAWTWRRGLHRLPRWYVAGLHAVVGFLMFNATVVFGPAWWRWAAGVIAAWAAVVAVARRRPGRFT